MAVITIIGAGMMGSALAFPARENGHEVRLVGTPLDDEVIRAVRRDGRHPKLPKSFPQGVVAYFTAETERALEGADLVICGVSSFGVEWFGREILPILPDGIPVLSVTKGLWDAPDGRLLTYLDVWQQLLDESGKQLSLNAIGGPCTSYELVQGDHTEVVFCGRDPETLRYLRGLMATGTYHVGISTDVCGIESAVALKNGYALAVALTIGLNQRNFGIDSELHFNSQAAVFGQAVSEMALLLQHQGAGDIKNLCVGAGDLYVTVYGGRTRQIGILLGCGLDIDAARAELSGVTLESLVVAERVARAVRICAARGEIDAKKLPLLMHVDNIITKKAPVDIPWDSFCLGEM